MGAITSCQPWRINDSVPSKSKSTWLICGRGANPGANSTRPVNWSEQAVMSFRCSALPSLAAIGKSFCLLDISRGQAVLSLTPAQRRLGLACVHWAAFRACLEEAEGYAERRLENRTLRPCVRAQGDPNHEPTTNRNLYMYRFKRLTCLTAVL